MDLNLEEQRLLSEFRTLSADGQKDLLAYAALLLKQQSIPHDEESTNQCGLKQPVKRPEAATEPIFTE